MLKPSFLLLALCFIFGHVARADLTKTTLVSLNAMYIDREYTDNGVESKSKQTDWDLRLMRVEKSFGYGAIYSTSSDDAVQTSRTSYGLSGGYYSDKDVYINAHYFLSSKYKLGGGTEYTKGNGFGLDLGFLSKLTPSFLLGLVVTYRSYSYSELSTGGVTSSTDAKHTELLPMFTFAAAFQ